MLHINTRRRSLRSHPFLHLLPVKTNYSQHRPIRDMSHLFNTCYFIFDFKPWRLLIGESRWKMSLNRIELDPHFGACIVTKREWAGESQVGIQANSLWKRNGHGSQNQSCGSRLHTAVNRKFRGGVRSSHMLRDVLDVSDHCCLAWYDSEAFVICSYHLL